MWLKIPQYKNFFGGCGDGYFLVLVAHLKSLKMIQIELVVIGRVFRSRFTVLARLLLSNVAGLVEEALVVRPNVGCYIELGPEVAVVQQCTLNWKKKFQRFEIRAGTQGWIKSADWRKTIGLKNDQLGQGIPKMTS